jgi:hypothetical protein
MVQRLSDGAYIPPDDANSDYAEYKKWATALGLYPTIREGTDAPLGWADPVSETRNGHKVGVIYPLGTPAQIAAAKAEKALAAQRAVWAERAEKRRREAAIRTLKPTLVDNSPASVQARLDALRVLTGA